jgi:hypothetical protein
VNRRSIVDWLVVFVSLTIASLLIDQVWLHGWNPSHWLQSDIRVAHAFVLAFLIASIGSLFKWFRMHRA